MFGSHLISMLSWSLLVSRPESPPAGMKARSSLSDRVATTMSPLSLAACRSSFEFWKESSGRRALVAWELLKFYFYSLWARRSNDSFKL